LIQAPQDTDIVDGHVAWEDINMEDRLPQPTPYDMAGYVRGLNTAGKLALMATVLSRRYRQDPLDQHLGVKEGVFHEDNDGQVYYVHHIALVDLALEKILSAPTHLKKSVKSRKPRKEVGLHLDKTKK
jgi:hypothetical protein